jgi:hypothetical protein
MNLCYHHDGFNGTVGLSLSQVLLESVSEDGQLSIGLEATEGLLSLQHAGGGPSERHLGVPPAFDVAGDLARRGRPRTTGLREVVNALFYLLSTGCQWRMLPKEFPPRSTVHRYFTA